MTTIATDNAQRIVDRMDLMSLIDARCRITTGPAPTVRVITDRANGLPIMVVKIEWSLLHDSDVLREASYTLDGRFWTQHWEELVDRHCPELVTKWLGVEADAFAHVRQPPAQTPLFAAIREMIWRAITWLF